MPIWLGKLALGLGAGAVAPPGGYVFLRGRNADGSYFNLGGLQADASRVNLAGKVS